MKSSMMDRVVSLHAALLRLHDEAADILRSTGRPLNEAMERVVDHLDAARGQAEVFRRHLDESTADD